MADCHDNYVLKADGDNSLTKIQDSSIYDDGTKVGIGTTSPYAYGNSIAKLHIDGSGDSKNIRLRIDCDDSYSSALVFKSGDNKSSIWNQQGNGDLRFAVGYSGDYTTESMIIDASGKVGIGTTNPGAQLDVDGGDIRTRDYGKGIILTSPDGKLTKRIYLTNSGTLGIQNP